MNWMGLAKQLTNSLTKDYVKVVPYQIKKIAVKDSFTALISNCKKTKQTGKPFHLKFKSRKQPVQSCYIPKSAVKEKGIYYTIAKALKYSEKDWFEKEIQDCRLVCDNGRWFITIPMKVKVETTSFENQEGIVALDPGIRSFITYFSTDGRFGWLGYHSFKELQRISFKMDKLISRLVLEEDKKKAKRLKRSIKRLRWRLRDLVDEMHWNIITYLTKHYKVILLPTFEVSNMTTRFHRKLVSKSVRNLLNYRFYEFGQRLQQKCDERGVTLLRVNEAFTSKTNSFTGEIMSTLGGKESFVYDGVAVNRDVNGARNILLRAMRDGSACA